MPTTTDRPRVSPWSVLFVAALALIGLFSAAPWSSPARADSRRKLSNRQMKKLMNRWARELGVKCDHCHVKKDDVFDYDADTPNKAIAAYCDEHFVEKFLDQKKKEISCQDCHNRKLKILPRPKKGK